MKKRLFILSPHFDDAAFSCGGIASSCSIYFDEIHIINIFSASPPTGIDLPPQAKNYHKNFNEFDPVAYRRSLDINAFNLYDINLSYVDQLDAIYRINIESNAPLYLEPIDIFTQIHATDYRLIPLICSKIISLTRPSLYDLFYVPLSIGGHVDHEITRLVGEEMAKYQLIYYEDCPYAFNETIRNPPSFCCQGMDSVEIYIPPLHVLKKESAINAYHSTISTESFIQYMKSHDMHSRCIERVFYCSESLSNISKQMLFSMPGNLSFRSDMS